MNKKYYCQILFLLLLPFLSCEKIDDGPCRSFAKAPVTKVEGASTASVNQEIDLTVSFQCFNGCGQFGNFDEVVAGNTTTITVNAKYEGCVCTLDLPIRQVTYKFKRSQTGTFDLKFLQTENNYWTHTIVVQ